MIAQSPMDITLASPLLGGLSPQTFMRRHWQKKPLLVRQAVPGGVGLLSRTQLFELAGAEEVESRLVVHRAEKWSLKTGPLPRSALPPLKQRQWTLLVQGLDLHVPAARALLDRFRFVPDARLDDLMMSFATDGGGVGPHIDSYDVFLLQAQGRRRWRIGRVAKPELVPGVPLKVLSNFEAEHEWLLEPGDMLYLPPGWAHDGVADGECTTCSIGFRAAGRDEISREVLQRMLDAADVDEAGPLYRDPAQSATGQPGRVPEALGEFASTAVARLLRDPRALACALGEVLSEPKRGVWFDEADENGAAESRGVRLDQRTRMLYDDEHVFINGESFRAGGRDAKLMRSLADKRVLGVRDIAALSDQARQLVDEWIASGWLRFASAEILEGDTE
jgi:50S ribosomal protein L16 3-hydroxylase